MTTDFKEIFAKAKAELQTRGRISGDLLLEDGRCCLLGAIGLAVGVDEDALRDNDYDPFLPGGEAYDAVEALVDKIPDEALDWMHYAEGTADYVAVYTFNDSWASRAPKASDEVVFELLDRASA